MKVESQHIPLFSQENPLKLDSGKHLGPVELYIETLGRLNKQKNNAILICHALTHGAHVAGKTKDHQEKGWWDTYVGPGRAIDTNYFYVVCSNILGSCYGSTGPTSINPETKQPYGANFPIITVHDMVRAQKKLMDHLDIPTWAAVVGGSLGGLQALCWASDYPDRLRSCLTLAATAQVSTQAVAFDYVGTKAIQQDPNYKEGAYTKESPLEGLSLARMLAHITYSSEESFQKKFGRLLQKKDKYSYSLEPEFQVENYLQYQGNKFLKRFDANTYLILKKALSYFDIKARFGSIKKAFKKSNCDFLIVAMTSDWLYTPKQSQELAKALMQLNKNVSYLEVDSKEGHDGFLKENPILQDSIAAFLKRLL